MITAVFYETDVSQQPIYGIVGVGEFEDEGAAYKYAYELSKSKDCIVSMVPYDREQFLVRFVPPVRVIEFNDPSYFEYRGVTGAFRKLGMELRKARNDFIDALVGRKCPLCGKEKGE